MPTQKKFLDLDGLIQLLLEIESLDETNIKDFYWSTDNADTYPTVVFKIGDDNGSPHATLKITFKGDIVNPAPANATTRSITLTINNVDKTITYYDTTGSAGITYTNATDTGDPTAATNVKVALDRVINKLNSMVGTDEKVKLTAQTGSTALPILTAVSGTPTSGANAEAGYDADFKFTPSSNTLIVKAATSSTSGVTITPSSIKVGTTATNGAAELTPSLLKVGSGTLTSTAYSGKATQTETDLAVHSGTNDGATKVGYSSSETGYTGVTTVDGALDLLITDVKNAQATKEILVLTGNEYGSLMLGSNLSPAVYLDTCQKVADTISQFDTPIFAPNLLGLLLLDAVNMYDDNGNCTEFSLTFRRGSELSTFALYIHAKKVNGTWVKLDDQKVAVNGDNRSLAGYVSEGMLETALANKQDIMNINIQATVPSVLALAGGNAPLTITNVDKTYSDITTAISNNKLIVLNWTVSTLDAQNITMAGTFINCTEGLNQYIFFGDYGPKSSIKFVCDMTNNGTWTGTLLQEITYSSGTNVNFSNVIDGIVTISALDEKVNQTAISIDSDIPMLLANSETPSNGGVLYDLDLKYNPSSNTLKVGTGTLTATNYSGTSARATSDGSGNNIINTYATKAALEALTNLLTGAFLIVSTLPTADGTHGGIIYLIKDQEYGDTNSNIFKEYVEVNDGTTANPSWKFELLGTTDAGVDVVTIPATGNNSVHTLFALYVLNA